ncbi:helix-turn-helix domain-containing protein [Streptomyces goshikiensis]|uniref:helix-turn-helix domain-containing protein n=1 Tax=Streptomyces goshikiensis TaxID=1942 RepID=UPI0036FD2E5A
MTPTTTSSVGALLRTWRGRRGISQPELAGRAGSSSRHISFVETGRARPSEELLLRLADRLDVPVRERNALLLAAGYAPRYAQTPLDDPSMRALREGLERLLTGYEPYPALVVDATYTVVAADRGIAMLLEGIPEHLLTPPLNAMRLTLHPEGLARRIHNLDEWRGQLTSITAATARGRGRRRAASSPTEGGGESRVRESVGGGDAGIEGEETAQHGPRFGGARDAGGAGEQGCGHGGSASVEGRVHTVGTGPRGRVRGSGTRCPHCAAGARAGRLRRRSWRAPRAVGECRWGSGGGGWGQRLLSFSAGKVGISLLRRGAGG